MQAHVHSQCHICVCVCVCKPQIVEAALTPHTADWIDVMSRDCDWQLGSQGDQGKRERGESIQSQRDGDFMREKKKINGVKNVVVPFVPLCHRAVLRLMVIWLNVVWRLNEATTLTFSQHTGDMWPSKKSGRKAGEGWREGRRESFSDGGGDKGEDEMEMREN